MKIEYISIEEIKPYNDNAKVHKVKQVKQVADSIKRFGFAQPLVVDKNNELIIGHCRLEASKELGYTEVPVLKMEELSEKEVKALRLADNKLNESEWDMALVLPELRALDTDLLRMTGFREDLVLNPDEERYTKKIVPPVYEPSSQKPLLSELYQNLQETQLLEKIKETPMEQEEAEFLREAVHRLTRFDYKKIADYYANTENEGLKSIMEDLALVIIDYDKAIELGYIKLSNDLLLNDDEE
jgi:ParB-like chromosome segregation protein Spo0J